jgi:hypothetical protein
MISFVTVVTNRHGAAHRKLRAYLIAQWATGLITDCWRCGKPLTGPPSQIHLGHTDDGTAYAGLEHGRCNVVAGNENRGPLPPRQLRAIRRKKRASRIW